MGRDSCASSALHQGASSRGLKEQIEKYAGCLSSPILTLSLSLSSLPLCLSSLFLHSSSLNLFWFMSLPLVVCPQLFGGKSEQLCSPGFAWATLRCLPSYYILLIPCLPVWLPWVSSIAPKLRLKSV